MLMVCMHVHVHVGREVCLSYSHVSLIPHSHVTFVPKLLSCNKRQELGGLLEPIAAGAKFSMQ